MSDDSSLVRSLILDLGIPLTGSVIKDIREGDHYFAVVPITWDIEGRQTPSARRLAVARDALRARGHEVDFVIGDPQTVDVEGGLRVALANAYGEGAISVAVALQAKRATVWVELVDAAANEDLIASVRAKIELYFQSFDLSEVAIQIAPLANLPSILACLRAVRQLAPVDLETLSSKLQAAGFSIPSTEWLSHRLDSMRRTGKIVRLRNGTYALTADSLSKLGTSKTRASPDVNRMLALARRPR